LEPLLKNKSTSMAPVLGFVIICKNGTPIQKIKKQKI
jgi:hypothetical protein